MLNMNVLYDHNLKNHLREDPFCFLQILNFNTIDISYVKYLFCRYSHYKVSTSNYVLYTK